MTTVSSADPNWTMQHSALVEGLHNLTNDSLSGTFTFTQYNKVVLSQDGYVFWVADPSTTITVRGDLHVSTDREQEVDGTIAYNSVILDSQDIINEFNKVSPTTMWIGTIPIPDGGTVMAAFQRRGPFFENAGIYHYAGFAIFPPFSDLIVSSVSDIPQGPIVSNSLPIWLNIMNKMSAIPGVKADTSIPVYPSFLVPENIVPPYIVVNIDPDMTTFLQAWPEFVWTAGGGASQDVPFYQLAKDEVELILYGLNNQQALQFMAGLMAYSEYYSDFGFMSSPVFQDQKRTQPEISAIALKKTLRFNVDYYMSTADAIGRQLIESALVNYTVVGG